MWELKSSLRLISWVFTSSWAELRLYLFEYSAPFFCNISLVNLIILLFLQILTYWFNFSWSWVASDPTKMSQTKEVRLDSSSLIIWSFMQKIWYNLINIWNLPPLIPECCFLWVSWNGCKARKDFFFFIY
jgi:hypothetical protein